MTDPNIAYDLRRMLRVITDRLENAVAYKGDESSEWADKETDIFWVKQANELLKKTST